MATTILFLQSENIIIHNKTPKQYYPKPKTMKELKRLLLSILLIFASTIMYAQTEITGLVIDETGEGVIGATVMEKGTSNGTVTDFDGNFTLKVNAGATLVITYIG
jgi:hypothetical protein